MARSLRAASRRGGGPQPPGAAGALTPSPALSLARRGSDGASGARCPPAWQLLPAQHMRSPVRARLSPGAAPFRGLRCDCRHLQAGGRGLSRQGQGSRVRAVPAPPLSLRNLVAPRPCAQPRGGGCQRTVATGLPGRPLPFAILHPCAPRCSPPRSSAQCCQGAACLSPPSGGGLCRSP